MRARILLVAFLLTVGLCFVSGVGYGEIEEWLIERRASLLDVELLKTQVSYMMRNPTSFLSVSFYYDPTGFTGEKAKLPKNVNTSGKIFISVVDNRGQFSYKSGVALLDTFKGHLKIIYSFILVATDMKSDIVAVLHSKGGIPLAYFYEGEYYLWDEEMSKEEVRTDESAKETERAPTFLEFGGQIYTGATKGHWVSEKIDRGRIIKLEDGSLWEISPLDRIETMLWLVTESITVIGSTNPFYPYYLLNTSTEDLVEAKLISL